MKLKQLFPIVALLLVVTMSGCKKDNQINKLDPKVSSTIPVNEATSIATNSKISASFNVEMNASTINITNFTITKGSVIILGTTEYTGKTATFIPSENLSSNTVYTATITTGAKNISGKGLVENYIWSFTTGVIIDSKSPTVILTNPAKDATKVDISKLITATFSEPMDRSTINLSTFTLKQGSTSIVGAVTYIDTTATFTPAAKLDYNKIYTGTISTGAKDMAGNAMAADYNFSFTTGANPDVISPTVISINPVNNAMDVMRSKVISITFSEAMDPLTINATTFYLNQGTNKVAGTIAYSGTTATFTPSNVLLAGMNYTATLTTGAKDLAGNTIVSITAWSFTTMNSAPNLAVVNLGAAGNYVILAKTAINNISTSAINGDLGLSPAATSYITGLALTNATGYATSSQVTGHLFAADMADPTPINLTTAVENMITAYTDAAGRPLPDFVELGTGNIGGKTLTPGLYKWTSTVTMPADVTISGGANDVWIFQISGDLLMSSAVKITLVGGAQAKNIFWQVAGQATLGTTSHFEGIILSMTGITLQTGASFNGRALAQTAVVLDANAVVKP